MKVYTVMEENKVTGETRLVNINRTYKGACDVMEHEVELSLRSMNLEKGYEDDSSVIINWKQDDDEYDEKEIALVYWITARELEN